jgi:hypothetical protein
MRSADWQSAVSPIANRRSAANLEQWNGSGLPIRDTAGCQPALRAQSRHLLFPLSRDDLTTTLQNQKTYGRFFGTIFLGGRNSTEETDRQQLTN